MWYYYDPYTFYLFVFLVIFSFIIFLFYSYIRLIWYFLFCFVFLGSLFVFCFFNKLIFWYQFLKKIYIYSVVDFSYTIGIDNLNFGLVLLTCYIILLCFLWCWYIFYLFDFYIFLLIITLVCLVNVFLVMDFFFFFLFFETVVIPMFFLIGIWGSRVRRIYAAYQLFLYTLFGSIFILWCFISLYLNIGSSIFDFCLQANFFCFRELIFWFLLFLGFSVKIPIIPFHIWLPEAHVEAPTQGSVILAALVLKLGTYAMMRFLFQSFTICGNDLVFIVFDISLVGLLYSSLAAINQIDFKKIVAYASIAHMNFLLIGLFSYVIFGFLGSIFLMYGHAFTSAAFFFFLGVLYDRYKSRLLFYYGGFVFIMPLLAVIGFIICLSNFGFPGSFNFVGEFLILIGGFKSSILVVCLASLGLILATIYSLGFYSRVFFGPLIKTFVRFFSDICRLEFYIIFFLVFFLLLMGVMPNLVLQLIISIPFKVLWIKI